MRPGALPLLSVLLLFTTPGYSQGAAQQITLPDLLAVELPAGKDQIGPDESPMRELLAAARSGTRPVTADLQRKVSPGPLRVTWTAWDGPPKLGKPVASRTARVIVLPNGMTPVGAVGDENATAGNSAVHIARDASGRVHMIWANSGIPGVKDGPVYRRAFVESKATVRFETEPVRVAEDTPGDWNSYPALAVSGAVVQLVWQGGGTARTRRLMFGPSGWSFGPIRDTGAKSGGRDVGPAVAIDGRGVVHIVTPDGVYAWSTDQGNTWRNERIPLPPNETIKTASLSVDPAGQVVLAFSAIVSRPNPPGEKLGGYWQLRTITRNVNGSWTNPTDVLAPMPGWAEPAGSTDMLADWVRIAADQQGGFHLTWHGTVNSGKFGNDSAFYAWRRPGAGWEKPVQLIHQDPARGTKFSFAPSIAIDGNQAIAVVFYDVFNGPTWIGFDSALATFRVGQMRGSPVPLTQFVRQSIVAKHPENNLSSRFPAAAPAIWHGGDGRLWLDVLELLQTGLGPPGPNLVVYHRVDVTRILHP